MQGIRFVLRMAYAGVAAYSCLPGTRDWVTFRDLSRDDTAGYI